MTIVLVLLAVSFVAYAAMKTFNKLCDRWSELPHFEWNSVGGVYALCAVADLEKAKRFSGYVEGFVNVADTLVCSDSHAGNPFSVFSGVVDDFYRFNNRNGNRNPKLFVPFASEKFLQFATQKVLFNTKWDLEEFNAKKRKENRRADIRMRLAAWGKRRHSMLWALQGASAIAFGIVCFVAVIAGVSALPNVHAKDPVVVYLATPEGGVQEIKTTAEKEDRLAVRDEMEIIRGRVTEMQYVGGGNSRACIQRLQERTECGFAAASLGLKKGDEAYIQKGMLLRRTIHDQPYDPTRDGWVITKDEAERLVATGKFAIVM